MTPDAITNGSDHARDAGSPFVRRIIQALLGLILRTFFRHIEIAGGERVPASGPVIFVLNHPNGLVDPVFILCLTSRRVSFLAKSPLFRMPVIGYLVRSMDAIPVYRKQDTGEDTSRNRETFEQCRNLLKRGGTIAICPEGVSHNEPRLRPLKTGAARIALGAASSGKRDIGLRIVPCGLYYTAKTAFRSAALLSFGEPLKVEPVVLGPDGEPPREIVAAFSNRIEEALREVVLSAEHDEAMNTIARAERIFSSEALEIDEDEPNLAREFEVRQRFIEGYAFLRERDPDRLAALASRITRYEEELEQVGLDPRDLSTPPSTGAIVAHSIPRVVGFILLFPFALAGGLLHYPAYKLAGFIAVKFSRSDDDIVSTIKIFAATLLFPLTWLTIAILLYVYIGWIAAIASLIIVPLAGWTAVRFFEELDRFIAGARALAFFITRRWFFYKLLIERRAIRKEILSLGAEAYRVH